MSLRLVEQRLQVYKITVQCHHLIILLRGNLVNIPQQFEGFDQRQRPPELGTLSEYYADLLCIPGSVPVGHLPVHQDLSGGGLQHTGHHFNGGGLPCPVGSQISYHFPRCDLHGDIIHRPDDLVIPGEQITQTALESLVAIQHLEFLCNVFDLDHAVHGSVPFRYMLLPL